jgi:trans-aconitate 2-methyltransferase
MLDNRSSKKTSDRWDAQFYKKHSQGQYQRGIAAIEMLSLHGDENILDVGCGDGRITSEIAKRVPKGFVFGVDLSKDMIDEAKKTFSDVKNLEFINHDITIFNSDKKFDRAVSFAAFHWIKDQKAALKNIFNALKLGGKLFILMSAERIGPIPQVFTSKKWRPFLQNQEETFFPQNEQKFKVLLEDCGFCDVNVYEHKNERMFKSKEELCNWAMAWVPQSTGFSKDKAQEISWDIAEAVSKDNEKLILDSALLQAQATKLK